MFIPLYDHNPLETISRPYVTWTLILLNSFIFFFVQSGHGEDSFYATTVGLGLIPVYLLDGLPSPPDLHLLVPEWATLVTYAFLHGDIWHLLGNMVFLWVFGDNVEDALGHVRYIAFYLLAAIAGGALHALMMSGSNGPLIGASGAISGIVAAYLMLHPRTKMWILAFGRIPLKITARWPILLWIAFQFIYVFLDPDGEVAWWAHVGGLIAGAVMIIFMRKPGVELFDKGITSPPTNG